MRVRLVPQGNHEDAKTSYDRDTSRENKSKHTPGPPKNKAQNETARTSRPHARQAVYIPVWDPAGQKPKKSHL